MLAFVLALCAAASEDLYSVLGLTESASLAEIKKAYYKLAQTLHPDKVDGTEKARAEERFKRVTAAYEKLGHPSRRKAYDEMRRKDQEDAKRQQHASSAGPAGDVRTVENLSQLEQLALDGVPRGPLKRHMLLAFYDSRSNLCTKALRDSKFPYPFTGWSQEWHGIRWEEHVLSVAHDVADTLSVNGASPMLQRFGVATKRTTRGSSSAIIMAQCPVFVGQLPGEVLGQTLAAQPRTTSTKEPQQLQDFVWELLKMELTVRNEHHRAIQLNWIHGSYVKEMRRMGAGETFKQMVFVSYCLQAEDVNRKGTHISDNSSLLIFNAARLASGEGGEMVIRSKCVDASADCEYWLREGECARNPGFMRDECPLSCGMCDEAAASQCFGTVDDERCVGWAEAGHCQRNRRFMAGACRRACDWCAAATDDSAGSDECTDQQLKCAVWARAGDCETNKKYMRGECARSCKVCSDVAPRAPSAPPAVSCLDRDQSGACEGWANDGHCHRNRKFMAGACRAACGWCDAADDDSAGEDECTDEQLKCQKWKALGECQKNEAFMRGECARICKFCTAVSVAAAKEQRAKEKQEQKKTAASTCKDKDNLGRCAGWAKEGNCHRNRKFMATECRATCGWCAAKDAESAGAGECTDEDIKCETWAKSGECQKNEAFMRGECARVCEFCSAGECEDTDRAGRCAAWVKDGHCQRNRKYMAAKCRASCGWCDAKGAFSAGKDECHDEDIVCETWAENGECRKNVEFMKGECARSCKHCTPAKAAAAKKERQAAEKAEAARRAEEEKRRAEEEKRRAEEEAKRAEEEARRAKEEARRVLLKAPPPVAKKTLNVPPPPPPPPGRPKRAEAAPDPAAAQPDPAAGQPDPEHAARERVVEAKALLDSLVRNNAVPASAHSRRWKRPPSWWHSSPLPALTVASVGSGPLPTLRRSR